MSCSPGQRSGWSRQSNRPCEPVEVEYLISVRSFVQRLTALIEQIGNHAEASLVEIVAVARNDEPYSDGRIDLASGVSENGIECLLVAAIELFPMDAFDITVANWDGNEADADEGLW